jgi:hypothetical protein
MSDPRATSRVVSRTGDRLATGRAIAAALAMALLVPACTSPDRPSVQADPVPRPTPLASYGPSIAATIAELASAVASVGHRLAPPLAAYQTSEPASLLQAPRVVLRADVADPGDAYVVVYDATDATEARQWARDLASYLGSGFGLATFTPDTQFSVTVRDDAVVFTTWSAGRSSDPARAEAVFDAVAGVGETIEIIR